MCGEELVAVEANTSPAKEVDTPGEEDTSVLRTKARFPLQWLLFSVTLGERQPTSGTSREFFFLENGEVLSEVQGEEFLEGGHLPCQTLQNSVSDKV